MTEMNAESVKVVFAEGNDKVEPVSAGPLLDHVGSYDDVVLQTALGKLGPILKRFSEIVDSDHPELGTVLKGAFCDKKLAKQFFECLEVSKFAVEKEYEVAKGLLSRAALTKIPSVIRSFDTPIKNQQLYVFWRIESFVTRLEPPKSPELYKCRISTEKAKMLGRRSPVTSLTIFVSAQNMKKTSKKFSVRPMFILN